MSETETPTLPNTAPAETAATLPAPPPAAAPAPAESTPAATTAPAATPTETPAAESSLLSATAEPEAKPGEIKPEEKPAEAKPEAAGEKKPEGGEAKPEGEQPPLPTYETFKLPEGFQADEKAMGDFTGLLGQLELAKGDHKTTQEIGQKMADLYTAELGKAMQKMTDYYVTLHNQDKQKMADELKKDPYFGASGDPTAQTKVKLEMANFLQRNVPKEELNAFRKFVDEKGIGDALPVARLINSLKAKIDRYESESSKMLPGAKPAASAPAHPGKGMIQKLYGTK